MISSLLLQSTPFQSEVPIIGKELITGFDHYYKQAGTYSVDHTFLTQKSGSPIQLRELLQYNPCMDAILSMNASITFLLDLDSNGYIYLSSNAEKILGYATGELQSRELSSNELTICKEDSSHIRYLTKQLLGQLKKLPFPKLDHYILNREYQVIKKDGRKIQVLEQSKVAETGKKGEVISIFGQLSDISLLKRYHGPTTYLTSNEKEESIIFSSPKSASNLSKRELQVMKLLAEGFSSKQIAHMLAISCYTVSKHRQKMLVKTQSKNSSELIHFAESNQLV